ncbi:hypothetical protein [Dishui Lake phycodnavirus 4]|nr:hypothetical protein [Dishui Lake phycodnavirus 4]
MSASVSDYVLNVRGDGTTNSVEIQLEKEIFEVSKISVLSGKIYTPQTTICATNNTFDVDNIQVSLDSKNYSDGNVLALDLQNKLTSLSTNVETVVFDSNTSSLVFGGGSNNFTFKFFSGTNGYTQNVPLTTPHEVLGFTATDITSTGSVLRSGAIQLNGPNALMLRFSSGSDIFEQDIFYGNPFYTGTIHLEQREFTNYIGRNDLLEHKFTSGKIKTLPGLKIEFFYPSDEKLIPYDFMNKNYSLKLKITCCKDRLKNTLKIKRDVSLPPPISIPEFEDGDRWENYKVYMSIVFILIMGVLILYVAR